VIQSFNKKWGNNALRTSYDWDILCKLVPQNYEQCVETLITRGHAELHSSSIIVASEMILLHERGNETNCARWLSARVWTTWSLRILLKEYACFSQCSVNFISSSILCVYRNILKGDTEEIQPFRSWNSAGKIKLMHFERYVHFRVEFLFTPVRIWRTRTSWFGPHSFTATLLWFGITFWIHTLGLRGRCETSRVTILPWCNAFSPPSGGRFPFCFPTVTLAIYVVHWLCFGLSRLIKSRFWTDVWRGSSLLFCLGAAVSLCYFPRLHGCWLVLWYSLEERSWYVKGKI